MNSIFPTCFSDRVQPYLKAMQKDQHVDVIIIGAGPIGLACAIELEKRGISYLVIERGCLVNSIFHYPTNMTFFSTSERLELGGVPFISHGVKPTRREALEYYRRVASSFGLKINLYEGVQRVEKVDSEFEITTSRTRYRCLNLVLASGFYGEPQLMNVPGEELAKVKHYYDEPHPYAGQRVVVVGGGNSAVDVALETYRCGSEVTLVVREQALKPGVKYWVRPDIENRINEGSIKAYFESEIADIGEGFVKIATPEGVVEEPNDFVLAMTGYRPNFEIIAGLGLAFHDDGFKTPVYDPKTHESSVKGLYLAGVVCGGLNTSKWFIENSIDHAEKIASQISKVAENTC